MSTTIENLWPEDITSDDVLSPYEILRQQAEQLSVRTNGILSSEVATSQSGDRVRLGLEVYAPRIDTRFTLFSVEHRTELDYPVAICPPDESLPDFLKEQYYSPGLGDFTKINYANVMNEIWKQKGKWVNNDRWIATSPAEFSEHVGKLLALPAVKGRVISLISRSNEAHRQRLIAGDNSSALESIEGPAISDDSDGNQ